MKRPQETTFSTNGHPLKKCYKCDQMRVPEGGIDYGPQKWMCAACWMIKQNRRKPAK